MKIKKLLVLEALLSFLIKKACSLVTPPPVKLKSDFKTFQIQLSGEKDLEIFFEFSDSKLEN